MPAFVKNELPPNTRKAIGNYNTNLNQLAKVPIAPNTLTVVIPAHNEESTIGKTLDSLNNLPGNTTNSVIISLNGCEDNTMEVVKTWCEEHGINPNVINIEENGTIKSQEKDSPKSNFTIVNRPTSKGKLQALLDAQIVFENQKYLPEFIFSLDADTTVEHDYVQQLIKAKKDDPKLVAVSGKVLFQNEEPGRPVGAFANSINSIHGRSDLGGNWIPGASALWDPRAFLAGYETIKTHFPGIKVEDAAMGLLTNIAGFNTKVLRNTPFITLPTNDPREAKEQMTRWLQGAAQLREVFGTTLSDLGIEAPLTKIITERVKEVLSTVTTLETLRQAVKTIAKELPFAGDYLKATQEAKEKAPPVKTTNIYQWDTNRNRPELAKP